MTKPRKREKMVIVGLSSFDTSIKKGLAMQRKDKKSKEKALSPKEKYKVKPKIL